MKILQALSLTRAPALAFAVIGVYWGAFAAHVPVLKAGLGASDSLFGLLILGQAIGLVSAMFFAPWADRVLGGRSMQIGAVFFALAWMLPLGAQTPVQFALSMTIVGAASGLLDVVMNARVSEVEAATGKTLMNANHGVFSLAYAVSAVLCGFSREMGYAPIVPFTALGVLVFAAATQLYLRPAVVSDEDQQTGGSYPWWPVLLCGGVVLVAFMSEATVETWSALHIERTLMGRPAEGALGPATLGLTMALGRFSGQAISDRFDDILVIRFASVMAGAGVLLAAAAPSPLVAYLGFGLFGLGVSVIGPLGLALVGRSVRARWRTDAIAKAAVMGFSGFFIAPLFMGTISDLFSLRIAFACVAVLLAMAWPLTLAVRRLPAP